jgi:hypothetical protein
MRRPIIAPPPRRLGAVRLFGVVLIAGATLGAATPMRSPQPTTTPVPEPPPTVGRVVYRASKVGSYESLGVPVVACRHRDPVPRTIAVEYFDRLGKTVRLFGANVVPNVGRGKKIVFVSDVTYYRNRDVIDMRVAHFVDGTGRVLSDARIIHCMAKMRFDPGALHPTYWRSMGLYRAGAGATPVPVEW